MIVMHVLLCLLGNSRIRVDTNEKPTPAQSPRGSDTFQRDATGAGHNYRFASNFRSNHNTTHHLLCLSTWIDAHNRGGVSLDVKGPFSDIETTCAAWCQLAAPKHRRRKERVSALDRGSA